MENTNTKCQFCNEKILESAKVCKHCGREQISKKDIESMATDIVMSDIGNLFNVFIIIALFSFKWWLGLIGLIGYLVYFGVKMDKLQKKYTLLEILNKYSELKKAKEKRKRRRNIVLIIISFILILTNPNREDFKNNIKNVLIENNQYYNSDKLSIIEDNTTRNNYIFFSVYKSNIYGNKFKTVGILGNFFEINE
jgi:predicted nucleic acid-binding Zn ribbon protein